MLTADELVDQAFGRVGEIGGKYPSARGPMYRRVGYRQRQLFVRAAQVNPERYGTCATANLTTAMADLNDIVAPVPTPELIQRAEIANAGTSGYAVGQIVTIVGVADAAAELPPRAYLRDGVLIGVSTDLDLVTSIKVFFARLPDLFLLTDASKTVELEAPWDTLFELDLSIWLVEKATALTAEARLAALTSFKAEESALERDWIEHVEGYTPIVSRFSAPRTASRSE